MNRGFTFLELLAATTVMVIIVGSAIPMAHASLDRSRTSGAATYVAARIAMARFEAVRRSKFVAVQFVNSGDGYSLRTFVDGNRNGVLARDIDRGIDLPLTSPERLAYRFDGVDFGIHPFVTNPDPGEAFDVNDPVQIGNTTLLSFNPQGSSTSGTLFIRGRQGTQFAVRVLGPTGRSRILHFRSSDGRWLTR
jgi:prepilin-type N-terminal cleavage/methylation domain-containing protein